MFGDHVKCEKDVKATENVEREAHTRRVLWGKEEKKCEKTQKRAKITVKTTKRDKKVKRKKGTIGE